MKLNKIMFLTHSKCSSHDDENENIDESGATAVPGRRVSTEYVIGSKKVQ